MIETLAFANLLDERTLVDYKALRSKQAWYADPSKGLIELRGDDVREWLQGQVTNDIRKLTPDQPLLACICTPTGQLLAAIAIYDLGERLLLEVDRQNLLSVLHRIEMMVVMEDVECRDLSSSHELYVAGIPQEAAPEGAVTLTSDENCHFWVPQRSEWVPEGHAAGTEAVDIVRLEDGIPLFGKDMNERTLPPEMGPRFEAAHISYQKGCYTGQEVLMRIYSRGHTNKTWVMLTSESPIEEGTVLTTQSGESAGSITSVVVSPKWGCLGAGMVKNQFTEQGTELLAASNRTTVVAPFA